MTFQPPSGPANTGSGLTSWWPDFGRISDGLQQIAKAINFLGQQLQSLATNVLACCRGALTVRVVTVPGDITVLDTDQVIVVRFTAPQAAAINLLPSPVSGQQLIVKDGTGTAFTYNLTFTPAPGVMIDNMPQYVMVMNNQALHVVYDGTQWDVIT